MEGGESSEKKRIAPSGANGHAKAVYMRDEDDVEANEDDELVRGSKRSNNGLKRSKSGSNLSLQERKQENERRKEKAKSLAMVTASLPVNTGE